MPELSRLCDEAECEAWLPINPGAFVLEARDGAGLIEVQLRLQKSLTALQRQGSVTFRQAAARQGAIALQRSKLALTCEADQQRLHEVIDVNGRSC